MRLTACCYSVRAFVGVHVATAQCQESSEDLLQFLFDEPFDISESADATGVIVLVMCVAYSSPFDQRFILPSSLSPWFRNVP